MPCGHAALCSQHDLYGNSVVHVIGVLERPALFDGIEEVTYKVLFAGKSGVGKTSVIGSLAGSTSSFRGDTLGIEVTDVYWPAKIWDKIIIFKIQCWEAGELSMKKYNHIVEVSSRLVGQNHSSIIISLHNM